jgi:bacterioferritin-associated ferredoxin
LKLTFNFRYPPDMVVCLCQGVSDKHVRRAIEGGASSRREVTQTCGAGGVCGGCHGTIAKMIRECGRQNGSTCGSRLVAPAHADRPAANAA